MKKKLLVILGVFLLLLGDYLYWTLPRSLAADLPEEVYSSAKADLIYYDSFFTPRELDTEDVAVSEILNAVARTEVTRRPQFGTMTMSQPFFYLYLYYPNGYTVMTVVENGNLAVTPDMYRDHHIYFDGGEELYQALLELTEE